MIRNALKCIRDCLGQVFLLFAYPFAALLNRLVTGNKAYDVFSRFGFHLLRKHYYVPIPDETDLNDPLVKENTELIGIDMNEAAALDFLQTAFPPFQAEFQQAFPIRRKAGDVGFCLLNDGFSAGDAHVYYAMIRHHRPKRIIEVGGGNSTYLSAAACLRNLHEHGVKPHLTVIEPYPWPVLQKGLEGVDRLIADRIQKVPMNLFTALEAGDIFFIDSSHVLRPGGDVQREYCEILPRLAPGVLVHIHDISLPKPYFPEYFQTHRYWTEQFLLQAFLTYNSRFEVIWPGTYMFLKHRDALLRAFPEISDMRQAFPQAEPSSFWIRVKETQTVARAA